MVTDVPEKVETARCIVCGSPAVFFCDYLIGEGITCGAPLCGRCSFHTGLKDYCPQHAGKPGLYHDKD